MRFSTNPGDILDDKVSTPRGLAIKLIGVEGARLPGSAEATTQDFVMQNAMAFTAKDPKAFLKTLKLLAKTTDKAPGMKKALSAVLRSIEAVIESVGGESGALKSLGGHPITHVLGETFNTVVPFLYGPYYAKLSVVPVSAALVALTGKTVDLNDNPDGLREAVRAFFLENDASWEVRIQLATDLEKMPIEDASVVWPEDLSPYVAVARIDIPRQPSWSEQSVQEIDEAMAFSPWHGLEAHRPLGGVMRVRARCVSRGVDPRQIDAYSDFFAGPLLLALLQYSDDLKQKQLLSKYNLNSPLSTRTRSCLNHDLHVTPETRKTVHHFSLAYASELASKHL